MDTILENFPSCSNWEDQPLIHSTNNKRLLHLYKWRKAALRKKYLGMSIKKATIQLFNISRKQQNAKLAKFMNDFRQRRQLSNSVCHATDSDSDHDHSYIPSNQSSSNSSTEESQVGDFKLDRATKGRKWHDRSYIPSNQSFSNSSGEESSVNDFKRVRTNTRKTWFDVDRSKGGTWGPVKLKVKSRMKGVKKKKSETSSQTRQMRVALFQSKQIAALQTELLSYHVARLDDLLTSNGLQRILVPADGNCMLNAVLTQVEKTSQIHDTLSLRKVLADHLKKEKRHYLPFLEHLIEMEEMDKMQAYDDNVEDLSDDGHWNSSLADCIPLAIANIFKSEVKIFSSKLSSPVIKVKPDLGSCSGKTIILAYIALSGHEHYDGTVTGQGSENLSKERSEMHPNIMPLTPPDDRKTELSKIENRKQETWKRNIRKNRRSHGQEYVSSCGKVVKEKEMKYNSCSTCRFKCSEKISKSQAEMLFKTFWDFGSYEKQRNFICQNVVISGIQRKYTGRKQKALLYHLPVSNTLTEDRKRVCQTFFLGVLSVGKKTVDYALKKKVVGCFVGRDERGRRMPKNKTPNEKLNVIREHIKSFPLVAWHYTCRGTRKTIPSIKKMFDLYEKMCKSENIPVCSYADIFDEITPEIEDTGLDCECVGGGRILHEPGKKKIEIYGYSQGYGQANHSITAHLIGKKFREYDNISWNNDGY